MDSIAARLKAKPRASKKPNPLYTSPAVRRNSVAKAHTIADLSSAFNWTEIFLVERALPQDPEVQTFMRYYRDRDRPDRGTAEFVRKRDEFLRKKLPLLYARGILPKFRARCIEELVLFFHSREDKEMDDFWEDWCQAKILSVEKAKWQTNFIMKKARERVRIRKASGDPRTPTRCCDWCLYNNPSEEMNLKIKGDGNKTKEEE